MFAVLSSLEEEGNTNGNQSEVSSEKAEYLRHSCRIPANI